MIGEICHLRESAFTSGPETRALQHRGKIDDAPVIDSDAAAGAKAAWPAGPPFRRNRSDGSCRNTRPEPDSAASRAGGIARWLYLPRPAAPVH